MPPSKAVLEMFAATPAYLGGKRKLIGPIFGAIDRHLPCSEWPKLRFVDAFCGGGSVSLYAKARFGEVHSCDVAARGEVIARAILTNNATKFNRVDLLMFLAGHPDSDGFIQRELADYFPAFTASVLDNGLAYAASVNDPNKRALFRYLAWRIACLALPNAGANHPSKRLLERATSGELSAAGIVQATFALRPPRLVDLARLAAAIHKGIFSGNLTFERASAVEASAAWHGDVWFLDPPYVAASGYASHYGIVDRILQDDAPVPPAVFFKAKTAGAALHEILENAKRGGARVVVWCNSRAWDPEEQKAVMGDVFPHVEEVEIKHKHASASGIHGGGGATNSAKSGRSELMLVAHL